MSPRQRFFRKILYALAIAALLLPLSWLSQPETTDAQGEFQGGLLARLRRDNQLSQANLGEIDPASETIKLATLGMRGVAANVLWEKAHYYRKEEDWTGLSATLEQIAKLQPNFISVWIFQGWNLSYNISVEFDDYHDRYYWVIRGINFLKEGTKYNKDEPRLLSDIGWTIANKIGRADEHLQFRRLFREDDEFNGARPQLQRDNWLVGREWMLRAEDVVDHSGVPVRGKSPLLFHSQPVLCLANYAEAIEEEGVFGEVAKNAWRKMADAWTVLANRDLPTPYNIAIRLSEQEAYDQRSRDARAILERLSPPGLREQILAEKRAALSDQEREILDKPAEQRTTQENSQMYTINQKMPIQHFEIAERITGEHRAEALSAAEEASQADFVSRAIHSERDVLNYDYWVLRCQIEPEDGTLQARKAFYDGDQAYLAARLPQAAEAYAEGLKKWRQVIDAHPALLNDANLTDELVTSIERYRGALHQLDEKFPEPFELQDVIEADVKFHGERLPVTQRAPTDEASSSANDPSGPSP